MAEQTTIQDAEAEAAAAAQAAAAAEAQAEAKAKGADTATAADVLAAASKAAARVAAKSDLPVRVRLDAPHSFYDDDGRLRMWAAGSFVSDPAEIALLVERGAPVTAADD